MRHTNMLSWPCTAAIAVLTALAAGDARAAPPVPACVEAATAKFQAGDFAAVLQQRDACASTTGHPRIHYLAAMAHLALAEVPHALLELQRYLAADLAAEPPRTVEVATVRRDQALAQTAPVTLKLAPPAQAGEAVKIAAKRKTPPGSPLNSPLAALTVGADGPELRLDPGTWVIAVTRPGYRPLQREVEVAAGTPATVELTTVADPPAAEKVAPPPAPKTEAPPPTFPRRPWSIAVGATGGVLVVAGLPTLAVGMTGATRTATRPDSECPPAAALDLCRRDLARRITTSGAGAGALGVGAGVLIAGLTGLARSERVRRNAWSAEVAVGGVMAIVGVAVLGLGLREFNAVNTANEDPSLYWGGAFRDAFAPPANTYIAGAGLLGGGLGLALGAGAGLLTEKLTRRRAAARVALGGPLQLLVRF